VLLKNVSNDGFTFFTNYNSKKGNELSRNRRVALLFGWYPLHRQVRAEGTAELVPRAESEAYFATRLGLQLGLGLRTVLDRRSLDELTEAYTAGNAVSAMSKCRARRLGWLPRHPDHDRVLAGPAEPDARQAALQRAGLGWARSGWPLGRQCGSDQPGGLVLPAARRDCASAQLTTFHQPVT
jgi:hypothetical protein